MENANDYQPISWKKGFLTIAAGQTVSLIGSSAVQFSLIWWLASETASPLIMSLAGLLAFLPQFLLGPFAGVWVDRLSRKTVIIGADLFIGLVATVFAISFLIWDPPYWLACVVLGARAVGSVFHLPAIQAAVPMLVPKEELVRANSWSQFMQSAAFMVGPILGAAMYAVLPLPIILLTDLLGAVVASISVAVVAIPEIEYEKRPRPNFAAEIKEGIAVYLSDKRLYIVTMASAISMVFFMPLSMFYPLMTSDYFKATAWHLSINQLAYSIGMMLGAVAVSGLGEIKNKLGVVHLGLMVLGVASLLGGMLPPTMVGFWIFVALCLAMGASVNLYNIPFTAYLQETIPKEAQGRAFSLLGSLLSITMPIGLLIAGPVAERYGVPLWFLIAGTGVVIITGLSALLQHLLDR
ncbi:MAG: MFS transporter [bacterium]|jgi:DHA3 family macrolide efflux protein-like MFS transporter